MDMEYNKKSPKKTAYRIVAVILALAVLIGAYLIMQENPRVTQPADSPIQPPVTIQDSNPRA